jgi:hypothetical protein
LRFFFVTYNKVRKELTGSKKGEFLLAGYALEHRPVVSRLKLSSKEIAIRSIKPCAMNSIHSVFQRSRFYQITIIYFIMIGTEKNLAQTSHSSANPKQDTPRTDIGTRPFRKTQQSSSSMFFPLRNSIPGNINFIGSTSIMQVLEKHPELRDAVLKEYIRLQLAYEVKNDNNLKKTLRLYLIGQPTLEDDLKRKMKLYGLPYDPLRPRLAGNSVDLLIH